MKTSSPLYEARIKETPPLPKSLFKMNFLPQREAPSIPASLQKLFPHLSQAHPGTIPRKDPLRVGVLLSGGQAPGGHNVINGLMEGLKKLHPASELIGFLNGPKGLVSNDAQELAQDYVRSFLNTGGFDMIGSGREKIETPEQFEASLETVKAQRLDALVIIGGDDSNTNATFLAEYFLSCQQATAVIGVPKTIDGDLKNCVIEQPFGFDTAVKVYSEIIGNILKDTLSAKKYWYFIRLMGRSASHITLEAARQTHPNLTLISEEKRDLEEILDDIASLIAERAQRGKNYGAILIPEGIIEFLPKLPDDLLKNASYDAHGNLELSKIEVERLFIDLVKKRLDPALSFSAQPLFLGYEGRSAFPSYFDACYGYALGHVAALMAATGATGRMACVTGLKKPVQTWEFLGAPLLEMLTFETRKGTLKPVIRKALVDLDSPSYRDLKKQSADWRLNDSYRSPGPIQFWGPPALVEAVV